MGNITLLSLIKCIKQLESCIYGCCMIFVVSIILYYSFGIYILVNQYDNFLIIQENCDSKLWYYALLSLICFTDKLFIRSTENIYSYSNTYIILFLIELILIIFGSIELWDNTCIYDYFEINNELYIFCIVNYSIQILFTIIFIIKIILMNKNKITIYEDNYDNIEIESQV
jgi:hypothetical protein